MNKIDYKYKLGDLVVTSAYYRNSPQYFGIVVKRERFSGIKRFLYQVNWLKTGFDNRWIHEDDIVKVDDGL